MMEPLISRAGAQVGAALVASAAALTGKGFAGFPLHGFSPDLYINTERTLSRSERGTSAPGKADLEKIAKAEAKRARKARLNTRPAFFALPVTQASMKDLGDMHSKKAYEETMKKTSNHNASARAAKLALEALADSVFKSWSAGIKPLPQVAGTKVANGTPRRPNDFNVTVTKEMKRARRAEEKAKAEAEADAFLAGLRDAARAEEMLDNQNCAADAAHGVACGCGHEHTPVVLADAKPTDVIVDPVWRPGNAEQAQDRSLREVADQDPTGDVVAVREELAAIGVPKGTVFMMAGGNPGGKTVLAAQMLIDAERSGLLEAGDVIIPIASGSMTSELSAAQTAPTAPPVLTPIPSSSTYELPAGYEASPEQAQHVHWLICNKVAKDKWTPMDLALKSKTHTMRRGMKGTGALLAGMNAAQYK